eukprot:406495_1
MNPTFMKMFYKDIEEMGISKTYSQQTNRGKQSNNYGMWQSAVSKRRPPIRQGTIGMYHKKPMRQYQQQVYQPPPPICQQQVYQPQIYEQQAYEQQLYIYEQEEIYEQEQIFEIYEQQQIYRQEIYQPQVYQQQQMQQTQEVTCFGCGAIGHWARDCPSIQQHQEPIAQDYDEVQMW